MYLRCFALCDDGLCEIQRYDRRAVCLGVDKVRVSDAEKIVFLPDNLYYKALKPTIEAHEKGLPAVPKKQRAKAQKKPKESKKRKEVDDVKNA